MGTRPPSVIVVRQLGKLGHYPNFEIRRQCHLYIPSANHILSAVVQPKLDESWEYTEINSLVPEEVRLFSALTLSESNPWENGLPWISHWARASADSGIVGDDLRLLSTVERLREALAQEINIASHHRILPPHSSDSYDLSDLGDIEDAEALLDSIDTSDQLLLAGLSRLLGATRLMFAHHEEEEAALILFVSMGAALEFIRQHLEFNQPDGSSVPFSEVYAYISRTFPFGDDVSEFFQDMYNLRVIATHPASRFGEFWTPPVMASDLFELRRSTAALYRHILLGDIPES